MPSLRHILSVWFLQCEKHFFFVHTHTHNITWWYGFAKNKLCAWDWMNNTIDDSFDTHAVCTFNELHSIWLLLLLLYAIFLHWELLKFIDKMDSSQVHLASFVLLCQIENKSLFPFGLHECRVQQRMQQKKRVYFSHHRSFKASSTIFA